MRISTSIFIYILLFGSIALQAQTTYQPAHFADNDRQKKIEAAIPLVEKLYKEYAAKNHYPGFAFGVMLDGKLIYSGSTGYTNVENKTAATPQSMFRIASMSKSVTAMAILKLRDEGKLQLDDPAYKYVPAMKKLQYLTNDGPLITIRHLLTHAAGFPEDNPWGDRQLADTDAELIQLINEGVTFSNAPGIAYEYSNLGFALLGNIVTKVSGKPYQQYINENIFAPLGMKDTKWEYTQVPANKLAHGYRWLNEQWVEEPLLHDGSYGAMGGLITSIEDFSKYMAVHQQAWPPRSDNDNGPIKRSSVREMHHPWNFSGFGPNYKYPGGRPCATTSAYAYGLGVTRDCEGRVMVGHSGGLPGFGSQWRILTNHGLGVVAFSNLTYANAGYINMVVLDTLVRLAGLKPRELPPSPILEQRKSELVKLLPDWNNAEASKLFAENFFMDYSLDSLRKEAKSVFTKAGNILKVNAVKPENNLRGYFIMEGINGNVDIYFTLTPEHKPLIQEYHIRFVAK